MTNKQNYILTKFINNMIYKNILNHRKYDKIAKSLPK